MPQIEALHLEVWMVVYSERETFSTEEDAIRARERCRRTGIANSHLGDVGLGETAIEITILWTEPCLTADRTHKSRDC